MVKHSGPRRERSPHLLLPHWLGKVSWPPSDTDSCWVKHQLLSTSAKCQHQVCRLSACLWDVCWLFQELLLLVKMETQRINSANIPHSASGSDPPLSGRPWYLSSGQVFEVSLPCYCNREGRNSPVRFASATDPASYKLF